MPTVDELYKRRHARDREGDQRSPGQRDRDRILYTSAFRRLGGITQVAAPTEAYPLHTRLTHSLEVAQIGRRLAEKLRVDAQSLGLDPFNIDADIVEAAALAHDLGHPPFGHITEHKLDELVRKVESKNDRPNGGFGGNAQSFRIVTKLSVRHTMFSGLNLTRATLNAILKYPWVRANTPSAHTKWGAYLEEEEDFKWARSIYSSDQLQSVEAEIMDWADDVAYAVHDMEDFFRSNFVPLDRLVKLDDESDRFWENFSRSVPNTTLPANQLYERFANLMQTIGERISQPFSGSIEHRAHLRWLTSTFIMRYILEAVSIDTNRSTDGAITINIDDAYKADVKILKHLTWFYVINRPSLATQQYGQQRIITGLFDTLMDAIHTARKDDSESWILPERCRQELRSIRSVADRDYSVQAARIVSDYIAAMTESQCIRLYRRLSGSDLGSLTDPVEL